MPVIQVRDEDEYQSLVTKAANRLLIIDFTATWCGPCQKIAPVYSALSDKYVGSLFGKVDVDECVEVATSNGVRAMPTFLFLRAGKELDRLQGADPNALENKIIQHGGSRDSFSGEGQRLGGQSSSGAVPPPTSPTDKQLEEAQASLEVDESKPTTKIQVRLADGTKLTLKLNKSQAIGKVRQFISTARPDQASKLFILMTTFSTVPITNEDISIEDAKLENAVILQKI